MIQNNNIPWKSRVKELFIDWIVISVYLICLFVISLIFYSTVFGNIPMFSEWQSQLIATVFSVIPTILFFSYMDYSGGSLGKRKTKLKVYFRRKTFFNCLLRNIIKFAPWQIGHMGTIMGIYQDFDTLSIVVQFISIFLLLLMAYMGFFRKDKRHLGDLIAGTQVQIDN